MPVGKSHATDANLTVKISRLAAAFKLLTTAYA